MSGAEVAIPGLDGFVVSRETMDRLRALVALIGKWQRVENLVSPRTLGTIWQRHVADSAQLKPLFPQAGVWLDIGSGAGFPGLVVACLLASEPGRLVHLVESNARKCAFLRRAVAVTGAPAVIHQGRAETLCGALADGSPDVVTARAVAPLPQLLGLIAPFVGCGGRAALHKGRDYEREIAAASQSWCFDLIKHHSRIDTSSVILEISRLRPRPVPGKD